MKLANYKESGPGGYERAYIDHDRGGFRFSGSRNNLPRLEGVMLGLVKQRKLWRDQSDGGKGTLCSSPDAETGYPKKDFPWQEAYLNPSETLQCETCPMTKWNISPRCQERWFIPMWIRDMPGEAVNQNRVVVAEFTQSGITAIKEYFKELVASKHPPYCVVSIVSTTIHSRGNREFCAPRFDYNLYMNVDDPRNVEQIALTLNTFDKVRQDLINDATYKPKPSGGLLGPGMSMGSS